METLYAVIAASAGAILGSFFNVLIFRLPKGESIVVPGSRCPHCAKPLKPHENIPLLSYLLLRGRCSGCKKRISVQYPVVEAVACAAAVAVWHLHVRPALQLPAWEAAVRVFEGLTLLFCIPIFVIDLRHFIIPDLFTLGGLGIAAALSFVPGPLTPLQCLLGILTGGGFLYLTGILSELLLKKEGMGGGDVKLMAFFGALWGWETALTAIILASCIGAVAGIAMIAMQRLNKERRIPFGPFLVAGTWAAVMWGEQISQWYFRLFSFGR
jgi:leader peptidase (prepilin peptidase)/N-methyltransferase